MATPDWLLNSNIDINKFKKVDPAKFVSPSKDSKNTEKIIKKVIQNKQLKEFDPTVLFGKNGNVNKSVEDLDREILKNSQTKYIPNLNNEAGIKRFQKVEKLPITGKFDGDTIAKIEAMNNVKSEGKPQQPNIKPPVKKDTKYIPNFQTTAGIKEFQRRNKLNPDGVVGKFTIGAMEKKGIVPAGTQAAFIEMQKPSLVGNQAPVTITPNNPNYVSPSRMQEAEDDFIARDMGITPTQLQQMRQVDSYGPNNPDKDAMYAQIFRPQAQATAEAMKTYDAGNVAVKPQGWFDQVFNWFTRERTPEEKAAMNEQVRKATGYDMEQGLSSRFNNEVD